MVRHRDIHLTREPTLPRGKCGCQTLTMDGCFCLRIRSRILLDSSSMMEGGESGQMNKKMSVFIALTAGLAGGVASRYIAPPSAFAQSQPTPVIRAQSFALVDTQDHIVGTFASEPATEPRSPANLTPSRIVLRDSSGHEIWSASSNPLRRLSQR
jgi:hypothetical protein